MKTRLSMRSVGAVIVCVTAVAGTGVVLADAATPPMPLYERVLQAHEFPGFFSNFCPVVETGAGRWAGTQLSVDALRENGFVAGIREELRSTALAADALSVAAQFRSTQAARAEMEHELAASHVGSFVGFAVQGIPGARGFTRSSGDSKGYNVMFTDGLFQYLVGAGFATNARKPPTRAEVIAAATTLYRRVHGHPAG
jgi:hypothetical protein